MSRPPEAPAPPPPGAPKARRRKRGPRPVKLRPDSDLGHRLRVHGERSLTDAELVALTGGLDLQQAVELLRAPGGLARLRIHVDTALPEASRAAARLRACLELSKRMLRAKLPRGQWMRRPAAVAKYLLARYSQPAQEVAGVLYLNQENFLLEDRELFRGNRSWCAVAPEPILGPALRLGARGVLAWHIHPSGHVTPSKKDLAWTKRLRAASAAVGVTLVDHLIVGGTRDWFSMRQEGLLEEDG